LRIGKDLFIIAGVKQNNCETAKLMDESKVGELVIAKVRQLLALLLRVGLELRE